MSSGRASRFVILFALLLLWDAAIDSCRLTAAADRTTSRRNQNHALIIGIGNYQQLEKLKSTTSDADKMAALLTDNYDFKKSNITMLTDRSGEKPTLVNILTAIDSYTTSLKREDNLLIFFTGHSAEGDDGETYWIPMDGKKNIQASWLKHSQLVKDYFASDRMQVNNLVILTDSYFSTKLLRSRPVSLSPFDLRYAEKITEKAQTRSREVIAFGEEHWPGTSNTDNMGLFAYFLTKALRENAQDVIDFENLVFEENILFPIIRIAGAKLIRGRLRDSPDDGGQFIITKVVPAPIVDMAGASVFPEKGYPDTPFTFTAETALPAAEVVIEVNGKAASMAGSGKRWRYETTLAKVGTHRYRITARNVNDAEGKPFSGRFQTVKKRGEVANVNAFSVSAETGFSGDAYIFEAKTDKPAREVFLVVNNERYRMSGKGTTWRLSQTLDAVGTIRAAAVPTNVDGIPGNSREVSIRLNLGPTNIKQVKTIPASGYAGEEFTIQVTTDRIAEKVNFTIDGKRYPMKGKGRNWAIKRKIPDIGEKTYSVVALNAKGVTGQSGQGRIIAKRSPLPIPDIGSVDIQVVQPGKGYPGDRFAIQAKTTAPSSKVFIDIEGKRHAMTGKQSTWQYTATIDRLGETPIVIAAINKDEVRGQSWEGAINTIKRPAPPIRVTSAAVRPRTGLRGRPFTFQVQTAAAAKGVVLSIDGARYPMRGRGTQWSLERTFNTTGDMQATVAAINEDGVAGQEAALALKVMKQRYRRNPDGTLTDLISGKKRARFKDNGDGTVTDYLTSLMWTKQPKQIAVNWEAASDYCKALKIGASAGWRLPTIRELARLVDKKRENPALPPGNPFSNIITHVGYWSKSKHKFGPRYVYQMSLWSGKPNHLKKDDNAVVWPVRYTETDN